MLKSSMGSPQINLSNTSGDFTFNFNGRRNLHHTLEPDQHFLNAPRQEVMKWLCQIATSYLEWKFLSGSIVLPRCYLTRHKISKTSLTLFNGINYQISVHGIVALIKAQKFGKCCSCTESFKMKKNYARRSIWSLFRIILHLQVSVCCKHFEEALQQPAH